MSDLAINHGWPAAAAIAVGVASALAVGLVNGVVITVFSIEPIIATSATLLAAGGLAIRLNNTWITLHGGAFSGVATIMPLGDPADGLGDACFVHRRRRRALPDHVRAQRLPHGRQPGRRSLAGLAVKRRLVAVYALSGLLAGVAGYLEAGQLGIISQNDGTGLQFSAILAVLVGGLSVKTGGIGRVEKTLVGTLIAGMIANYFILKGVAEPYEASPELGS